MVWLQRLGYNLSDFRGRIASINWIM